MRTHDALVIGGGPGGATAAVALARRGWSVAVVEKARFPRRKVCGEYISPGGWEVLRALDCAPALEALAGPPVSRVGLFALDVALDVPMPAAGGGEAWGRALGRETLDAMLLDAARRAGAEVLQPWSAEAMRWSGSDAIVIAANDEGTRELRAPLVIAAHGSWEHGGLPTQPARASRRARDFLGFKARFANARLAAGLMPLVLFPGGYGGLVESDGGLVSFSCCIRRDALAGLRARYRGMGAGDAVLAHASASARGLREALDGAWREGAWLAAGPIRPGVRVDAVDGMIPVGNAAGEAHPLVAEGIGMAIQSAWLMAEIVGPAAPRGFDRARLDAAARTYARAWRRQLAPRVHASRFFAAATGRAMGASAALLAAAPAMLRWAARRAGKASIVAVPERP